MRSATGLALLALCTWAQQVLSITGDPSIVVNTWAFTSATASAWKALHGGASAVDAVQQGCQTCEDLQCDFTVGYGGSPDEESETSLDALIMDGATMTAGAVSNLRHVRHAIQTARMVMDHTSHTLLSGLQATTFALDMGLSLSNLSTPASSKIYWDWRAAKCQPNFRRQVQPPANTSCGPYQPDMHAEGMTLGRKDSAGAAKPARLISEHSHDTISMMAIDSKGRIAAGSSSNGASHKVPGRVGDAAVPGGGAYASPDGACGSTGDGDVHLRFQPCLLVVEAMRMGLSPLQATRAVVQRIVQWYPDYVGALVALNPKRQHAAAAHGWHFQYALQSDHKTGVQVINVSPTKFPPSQVSSKEQQRTAH